MKRTYQPSVVRRKARMASLVRMRTAGGRKVIAARRAKAVIVWLFDSRTKHSPPAPAGRANCAAKPVAISLFPSDTD